MLGRLKSTGVEEGDTDGDDGGLGKNFTSAPCDMELGMCACAADIEAAIFGGESIWGGGLVKEVRDSIELGVPTIGTLPCALLLSPALKSGSVIVPV